MIFCFIYSSKFRCLHWIIIVWSFSSSGLLRILAYTRGYSGFSGGPRLTKKKQHCKQCFDVHSLLGYSKRKVTSIKNNKFTYLCYRLVLNIITSLKGVTRKTVRYCVSKRKTFLHSSVRKAMTIIIWLLTSELWLAGKYLYGKFPSEPIVF